MLACVTVTKQGGGGEEGEKREGENRHPPLLIPSSQSPTAFDACYAG